MSNNEQVFIRAATPVTVAKVIKRVNPSKPAQGRFWMATIPKADWKIPDALPGGCNWIRGQEEIGEGGFHHYQVILGFAKPVRMAPVKRALCEQAHVELTRSAFADEYVWKEESRVEGTQFELGSVINCL